jgi:ribosomal protein S18 acetylase RimI-like enzyme
MKRGAVLQQPPDDAVHVRTMTVADLPAIMRLDEAATGLAKADYWQGLLAALELDKKHGLIFLVAELDGRVIGFITGNVREFEFGSEACGWVFALNVDQDVRDKNVGTRLFEALCDRFRRAGISKVRTLLARNNNLLLAFFRSLGMMTGPYIQLEKDLY